MVSIFAILFYHMEIIAYLACALIGISLGLIGGGGSILTVPVLVYLFGISPMLATSYSLFIVGTTSLAGVYSNFRKGLVNFRIALLFGITSITTVFMIRKFVLPALPVHFFYLGGFEVTQSNTTLLLFAILMIIASISMISNGKSQERKTGPNPPSSFAKLFFYGIAIGVVTGLLGAGGGFLLIPTLVVLVGLPMKEAVGTSLLIIALNSLIGFTGDIAHFAIDWTFLFKITAISVLGIIAGGGIGSYISGVKLKKAFGWFVLVMGIYILVRELYHH